MMLGTKILGLIDFFAGAVGLTPLKGVAGIPTGAGVAAGGLNEENPEVGAAFEPQVVQNDSSTEIS